MKRRNFIKVSAGLLGTTALPSINALAASKRPDQTAISSRIHLPLNQTSYWLGEECWGNRLQDWRLHNGVIECLEGGKSFEVRTFSLLTKQLSNQHKAGRLQTIVQNLTPEQTGYCGFLLGIGAGKLDYRGAALAQRAAGTNGGFMAVMNEKGELSFRDFSEQNKPLEFEKIARTSTADTAPISTNRIKLDCHIDPVANNMFDIRLVSTNVETGQELGFVVRTGVHANELVGGISLLSSPNKGLSGTRWGFSHIAAGGEKITSTAENTLGPVMGCLYSLNKNVLKLTTQLMPIDLTQHSSVRFDYKLASSDTWMKGPTSKIEDGFVALCRIEQWDYKQDYDYRIVFPTDGNKSLYIGTIVKDPEATKEIKLALYSCIIPTAKSLDNLDYKKMIPQERELQRYGPENILFPHNTLVENCDYHQPDLYIFCGDQYYETYPTRYGRETDKAKLDTLYRWYLWYWTFRGSVRNRPSIILADDHDVLQGNLWGNTGKDSGIKKEEKGGFIYDKSLVRMVYRMQHGHNPDAYDPTPIAHNIPVAYGSFVYGGISFAIVEDRKFKTPPNYKISPKATKGDLLGERQESFLAKWKHMDKGLPKICITASMWGSPQTKENQKPLVDHDSNGYPPDGRTRAVKLVSEANALVLAGDQHLGMAAKQGIDDFSDGSLFFAGPAAAAFWQRWFEGGNNLKNQFKNNPDSGNFVDSFGNKMRVLAVANPKISYPEFMKSNKNWGMFLADNQLKSEGYGIVKINHQAQQYHLECWPWNAHPSTHKQFLGWPITASFKGELV